MSLEINISVLGLQKFSKPKMTNYTFQALNRQTLLWRGLNNCQLKQPGTSPFLFL